MALHLILGRAGAGKTHTVLAQMKQVYAQGNQGLYLLTPEQMTFQAEKNLIATLGGHGLMDVEVLSFSRLSMRVMDEVGGRTRVSLDHLGKIMALRKIVEEKKKDLRVFYKVARQRGFAEKCCNLFALCKQYQIDAKTLKKTAEDLQKEGKEESLALKLSDLALLYEGFLAYVSAGFMSSEDAIDHLIEKAEQASFLQGAHCFMDGFDAFTPQTLCVIGKLMRICQEVTVTLTMDPNGAEEDLFVLGKDMARKLTQMAQAQGVAVDVMKLAQKPYKKAEFDHIERFLFAYPQQPYAKETNAVQFFTAKSRLSEIEHIACEIVRLVKEGYRYRDFAVICGDIAAYGPLIGRIFAMHLMPCFVDHPRPILHNPLVEALLGAVQAVKGGYRHEDMMRLFKTTLVGLSLEQVDELENAVLKAGIHGFGWKKPFPQDEPWVKLETYRQIVMNPLEKLAKALDPQSGLAHAKALYKYMEDAALHHWASVFVESCNAAGDFVVAHETAQMWDVAMNILDQLAGVLGESTLNVSELYQMLTAGFAAAQVAVIPTTLDQVTVGSAKRSREQAVKVLFVVGVNDGLLPSATVDEGLLSQLDLERLAMADVHIGRHENHVSAEQKQDLYLTFTRPIDALYVSHAASDDEGKVLYPSLLFKDLQAMFPQAISKSDVVHTDEEMQTHQAHVKGAAFHYLTRYLREGLLEKKIFPIWWEVYRYYLEDENKGKSTKALADMLFYRNDIKPLDKEKCKQVYGMPMQSSVSQLETYATCPFSHFVKYGLKAKEREEYEVNRMDVGHYFHGVMEDFSRHMLSQGTTNIDFKNEAVQKTLSHVMDVQLALVHDGALLKNERAKSIAKKLKSATKRVLEMAVTQLQEGDFVLDKTEAIFGKNGAYPPVEVTLPNGETVFLRGRIDRVDIRIEDGLQKTRIVDYKSGVKEFSLSDVLWGLQLQLCVYLMAATAENGMPEGMYYFHIQDPLISEKEIKSGQNAQDVLEKKFQLDGISLNSTQFQKLFAYVNHKMTEYLQEMTGGHADIRPVYKIGERTQACDYCEYSAICRRDAQFSGNSPRIVWKRKDVKERLGLSGKEQDNEQNMDA